MVVLLGSLFLMIISDKCVIDQHCFPNDIPNKQQTIDSVLSITVDRVNILNYSMNHNHVEIYTTNVYNVKHNLFHINYMVLGHTHIWETNTVQWPIPYMYRITTGSIVVYHGHGDSIYISYNDGGKVKQIWRMDGNSSKLFLLTFLLL